LLHELKRQGEQIIDLEFLAKHRGSSFGALAFKERPSQEQFENELFEEIRKINPEKRVWIEDESRTIGERVIPEEFWKQKSEAPRIVVDRTFDERLDQIVKDYSAFKKSDLKDSMQRIGKRLGPQHVKRALELLEEDDYRSAFEIALKYYDKAYEYQLSTVEKNRITHLNGQGISLEMIVDSLIKL
jgi:tRNA 2-selenouridine synthase